MKQKGLIQEIQEILEQCNIPEQVITNYNNLTKISASREYIIYTSAKVAEAFKKAIEDAAG